MNCYICGAADAKQIFLNKNNLGLRKCLNCKVLFTYPRADEQAIKQFYSQKDYFKHWFEYYDVKKKTDLARVEAISKYCAAPAKLLDFGCGPGIFIECAQEKKYEVYGVEYSDFAVEYCLKKKLNVQLLNDFPLNFADNFFDAITVWHTLEHLENPKLVLTELKRILKAGGLLVIEIPNYNGLLSRLRGNKALPLIEHLFHFTEYSIRYLLELLEFEIIFITHGNPGYTRKGLKVLIKKIFAKFGIFIHNISDINCADTILVYARK